MRGIAAATRCFCDSRSGSGARPWRDGMDSYCHKTLRRRVEHKMPYLRNKPWPFMITRRKCKSLPATAQWPSGAYCVVALDISKLHPVEDFRVKASRRNNANTTTMDDVSTTDHLAVCLRFQLAESTWRQLCRSCDLRSQPFVTMSAPIVVGETYEAKQKRTRFSADLC
jgi:hypothetical protein